MKILTRLYRHEWGGHAHFCEKMFENPHYVLAVCEKTMFQVYESLL